MVWALLTARKILALMKHFVKVVLALYIQSFRRPTAIHEPFSLGDLDLAGFPGCTGTFSYHMMQASKVTQEHQSCRKLFPSDRFLLLC